MRDLLSSSLSRAVKDKVFWFCALAVSFLAVYALIQNYVYQIKFEETYALDGMLFGYNLFVPFQCAVFCSLFLGTEYDHGVIRNKLIVGHTRASVYLANLIAAFVASVLMSLACLAVCAVLGTPMYGWLKMPVGFMATILVSSLLMIAAVCAVCTLCAMLIHKKALLAIVLLMGTLALMAVAISLQAGLDAPEFYPYAAEMVDGELVMMDDVANPRYLSGLKRDIYQFIYDFLPTGQAMQYNRGQADHPVLMCLSSIAITAVTTAAGLAAFRRKDIQ